MVVALVHLLSKLDKGVPRDNLMALSVYDVQLTKTGGVSDFGKEEERTQQRTVWSILAWFAPVSLDLIFFSSHFQKL